METEAHYITQGPLRVISPGYGAPVDAGVRLVDPADEVMTPGDAGLSDRLQAPTSVDYPEPTVAAAAEEEEEAAAAAASSSDEAVLKVLSSNYSTVFFASGFIVAVAVLAFLATAQQSARPSPDTPEGLKWLEEKAAQEGIITKRSGMMYKVLKEGKGSKPEPEDTIVYHLKATNPWDQVFVDTYSQRKPYTAPLMKMHGSHRRVLQKMKTGSKWMVYLPSRLAYGDLNGMNYGEMIKPYMPVQYEIEIVQIIEEDSSSEEKEEL